MRQFTPGELRAHLDSGAEPVLLDVREPWEYELARLPGSQLLPMGEIMNRMAELDAAAEIVVICHHGVRSRQVGHLLESRGFTDIINLRGGVDAWANEVDGGMPRY